MNASNAARGLAIFEGGFWLVTGIWPVIEIDSFMAVTGPKTDLWLVRTVGLLIALIGAAVLSAGVRGVFTREALIAAIGGPVVLTGIDVVYVAAGVIPPIYLADAAVETAIVAAWGVLLWNRRRRSPISDAGGGPERRR